MHHGKKVNYSASCLSALTASVICVVVVVRVSKKAVLRAKALSGSYRFCDSSSTHDCLLVDKICALCEKLSGHTSSFIRSRYTGGSNACNII
jgi:hypothetical protein